MGDWFIQLEWFDRILVLVTIVILVSIIVRFFSLNSTPRDKRSRPFTVFFLILLFLLVSIISGGYFVLGNMYQKFTDEKLIATISCRPSDSEQVDFDLTITIQSGPDKGKSQTLGIRGDQWAVSGHVLKWDPILTALGMKSLFKLTRIEGRYTEIDPRQPVPSVYILTEEQDSGLWHWFYRNAHNFPLVASVYGNMIYTFPSFTRDFNIYVTPTGFFPRIAGRQTELQTSPDADRPLR